MIDWHLRKLHFRSVSIVEHFKYSRQYHSHKSYQNEYNPRFCTSVVSTYLHDYDPKENPKNPEQLKQFILQGSPLPKEQAAL